MRVQGMLKGEHPFGVLRIIWTFHNAALDFLHGTGGDADDRAR
jgi:hypothetical protein